MLLPGRLRSTTLGDLLGTIHRARASGTLELTEDRGRSHRIHWTEGRVVAVEVDGFAISLGDILRRDQSVGDELLRRSVLRAIASQRLLGEVLVTDFKVAPSLVATALRRQIVQRLNQLDTMVDAHVRFRVAVRAPSTKLNQPLEPADFLRGRRRARDASKTPPPASTRQSKPPSERYAALHLLGLPADADAATIKQTYRRLVRTYHPDLHPGATDAERSKLAERFSAVTQAYQRLVA